MAIHGSQDTLNVIRQPKPKGYAVPRFRVLRYVREHSGVGLVVAAAAFCVEPPTLVDVVQELVRKGWMTNRP